MLTLPTTTPAPLTLEACRAMLAAGRTRVRVPREGNRQATIDGIRFLNGEPLIHGTYEVYGVARGGAGKSETFGGWWRAEDLIDDNGNGVS
jgi:hypothetical protein